MATNNVNAPEGVIECDKPARRNFRDLTGQQYGRLTVVEHYGKKGYVNKNGKPLYNRYWLCQCECGEQQVVLSQNLKSGSTTSCGCYNRECASDRSTIHGLSYHPSYQRYLDMVARCTDPTDKAYAHYGGRGIKVWHTWLEQEDSKGLKRYLWYLDNILGPCPGPGYSVDRIDNNDGYRPWNLRWADQSTQVTNQRPRNSAAED